MGHKNTHYHKDCKQIVVQVNQSVYDLAKIE